MIEYFNIGELIEDVRDYLFDDEVSKIIIENRENSWIMGIIKKEKKNEKN